MRNLGNLMKQAQQMQAKMAEMQETLAGIEVTGSSGAGMISVTMNGKAELLKVRIDPSLAVPDEVEVLEDLITAAFNDAKVRVEERARDEMSKLTGGIDLPPGFKLPF